jgi:hypothetical protein
MVQRSNNVVESTETEQDIQPFDDLSNNCKVMNTGAETEYLS